MAKDALKKGLNDSDLVIEEINLQEKNGLPTQMALFEITQQRTVPNIFIGGQHIGGCDDIMAGLSNGTVKELLDKHDIKN